MQRFSVHMDNIIKLGVGGCYKMKSFVKIDTS